MSQHGRIGEIVMRRQIVVLRNLIKRPLAYFLSNLTSDFLYRLLQPGSVPFKFAHSFTILSVEKDCVVYCFIV